MPFFRIQIIILLLIASVYNANGQEDTPLNQNQETLSDKDLEQQLRDNFFLVTDNPNKAIEFAERSLTLAKARANKDIELLSYLLLGQAYDNLGETGKGKGNYYTGFAYKSLEKEDRSSELGFLVTKQYADLLSVAKDYKQALKLYNESLQIFNIYNEAPSYQRYLLISEIAFLHDDNKFYDRSLEYYLLAIEEAKCIEDNKIWLSSAYNNLGFSYFYREFPYEGKIDLSPSFNANLEKAFKYYIKAKEHLEIKEGNEQQELFNVNIDENMAHVYYHMGEFAKAKSIYKNTSDVRRKYNKLALANHTDVRQLICALNLKDNAEIERLKDRVDAYFATQDNSSDYRFKDISCELYYKAKLEEYTNANRNFEDYRVTAERYVEYLIEKTDYIKKSNQDAINNYIAFQEQDFEKKITLEKELAQVKETALKKDNNLLFSILSILFLVLISLLLLLYVRKQKQRQIEQESIITKLTLQNTNLEKEKLNDMLESKHKDIVNIVADSTMRTKFLKSILKRINEKTSQDEKQFNVKELVFDIKSQIQIEERLTVLQSDLTNANAYFDNNLMEQYPSLTKTEREISSYIRLNFSIKEIAQIRSVSTGSIKMARSRIRKKMGLSQDQDLDQHISAL